MKRHETILRREDSLLIVIDYQERLVNVMKQRETVTPEILRLIQGAKILNAPILVTEQYPKGLGPTTPEIANELDAGSTIEKLTFSCCGEESFGERLKDFGRNQLIITGIETHVCVLQTVLDLLANDYQVHVPIHSTCSRDDRNRDIALSQMKQAGAILTNTESVLFQWLVKAGGAEFKAIQKLII